jgi:hypothetical protein
MSWFSNEHTTNTQQTYEQQAATESGFALGGGIGAGANVTINSPDQAALELANNAVTISGANTLNALSAAQQLAGLSVSASQANARDAFDTLQKLQTQTNLANAGASPGEIAKGAVGTTTWLKEHGSEIMVAILAALALGGLAYYTKRNR